MTIRPGCSFQIVFLSQIVTLQVLYIILFWKIIIKNQRIAKFTFNVSISIVLLFWALK